MPPGRPKSAQFVVSSLVGDCPGWRVYIGTGGALADARLEAALRYRFSMLAWKKSGSLSNMLYSCKVKRVL